MFQAVLSLAMVLVFQLLAVVGMRLGRRSSGRGRLLVFLSALVILSLATAQIGWLAWLAGAVLAGFWIRRALQRGATAWRAVLLGLVPVMVATGLPLFFVSTEKTKTEVERYVAELLAPATMHEAGPASGPEAEELAERSRQLAQEAALWLIRLLPAELLVFNLAEILVAVLIARRLALREGAPVRVPGFSKWRVPFATVWILAVGLALAATRTHVGTVVGCNVVLVGAALLTVQGLAVTLALLERSLPLAARWALVVLGALTALPFMLVGAAVLGLIDLWVDFRRPRVARPGSS